MGNMGVVNDLHVLSAVPLVWLSFFVWQCKKRKKEKKSTTALYLLYSGRAYVRTDDKSVTMLHHAGGQPTFTFVPVIKSFPC